MDVAQATSAVQEGEELELIYIYIYIYIYTVVFHQQKAAAAFVLVQGRKVICHLLFLARHLLLLLKKTVSILRLLFYLFFFPLFLFCFDPSSRVMYRL